MTSFHRVDDPPPAQPWTVRVDWAEVSALWWRDVRLCAQAEVELSVLDLFIVEAVGALGRLDADGFREFTGLPPTVFGAVARRLHVLGLVVEDGATLRPNDNTAGAAAGSATRLVETSADLMFLPETDDVVAIEKWPDGFQPDAPTMTALPAHLADRKVRELLAERVAARTVIGLDDAVVAVADDAVTDDAGVDEPLTKMANARPRPRLPVCPALRCTGVVRWEPHVHAVVTVGQATGGKRANDTLAIRLPGAAGLAAAWLATARSIGRPEHAAAVCAELAPGADPSLLVENENGWYLGLTGERAAVVAGTHSLTHDVGIQIRDKHAHITVALRYTPVDRAAQLLFDLDRLVDALVLRPRGHAATLAEHADVVTGIGGPAAVRRRTWDLGHYWLVGALRESEDFAYA